MDAAGAGAAGAGAGAAASGAAGAPGGAAAGAAAPMSEETRRRVEAAKQYIENMYRSQQQSIQERHAR